MVDAAADQVAHQHRNQRHGQACCCGHGIGLRKCQRREQLAFLGFEREDWHERQHDEQQREEQGRTDFDRRIADHTPVVVAGEFFARMGMVPRFDMLVRILDSGERSLRFDFRLTTVPAFPFVSADMLLEDGAVQFVIWLHQRI